MKNEVKLQMGLMVLVNLLVIVSWYFFIEGKASLFVVSLLTVSMFFTFLALLINLKNSDKKG